MAQLTALISVSDKTGIVDFAKALHALDVRLLSTGGTAKLLADAGLPVTEVAQHTGFPEMLDGRVKTLHPKIHGGLLARRDLPEHVAAIEQHGIDTIDILAVNLYPFEATVAKPGCSLEDAIENIDIGGPAMVRSAAKNWKDVTVLTDASQYAQVLEELKAQGKTSDRTRFAASVAAFNRIAQYDAAISNYLSARLEDGSLSEYPAQMNSSFIKVQDLRYGENSHQTAALYRDLRGTEPDGMYEMLVKVVEKPLLEVVMAKADNNQSRAAEWLGLNRNTLRKKIRAHSIEIVKQSRRQA